MPVNYKQLCRVNLSASVLTDIYQVASLTQTLVSGIAVCNRSATATTFRLSHASLNEGDTLGHYFVYDAPIAGNSTVMFNLPITMQQTDRLRAWSPAATLSIVAWGEERT